MNRSLWFYPVLFVSLFTLILILRWDVLHFPPYWDSVVGLFTEALWLKNHDFNYVRLALEEPGYGHGGARNLYFTVWPAFQALLMNWLSDADAFLIFNHLLTFALAASVLLLFHRLLRVCFDPWIAAPGTLLLFVHPLFLSQTDAINYEMATLACGLLAIDRTLHGHPVKGALIGLLGMYIKPTGIIAVVTLGLYHFPGPGRSKAAFRVAAVGLPVFFLQWRLRERFYMEASDTIAVFLRGSMKRLLIDLPDLLALFAVAALFCVWTAYQSRMIFRPSRPREPQTDIPPVFIMVGLFLACYVGFYIHIIPMLPRYFLYSLPFLLFTAIAGVQVIFRKPWQKIAVLALIAGLFLINMRGPFYPAVITNDGFLLERSLEYMDDMRLNIALAKRMESQYYNHVVVTSPPYTQMLTMPELGYVERPLPVVTVSGPLRNMSAEFNAALASAAPDTVWLYGPNAFSSRYAFYPDEDLLIERLSYGARQIVLFRNIE
jgi:hypothetical protein